MDRKPAQDQRLKFYNDVLYNALAPAYNAMDWLTLGAWWRLVRRALDYVPTTGSVLEVGFGPGKLQATLARRPELVAGVDLAAGMCRVAQRRLRGAGRPARLLRGNAFQLPFARGAFDTLVSTFAFSGFPDGQRAMHQMARVARRRVVIVDIGLPSDGNRVGSFWAHLWESEGDFLYDIPGMMQTAGLQVTTIEEFGPGRHIRAVVGTVPN